MEKTSSVWGILKNAWKASAGKSFTARITDFIQRGWSFLYFRCPFLTTRANPTSTETNPGLPYKFKPVLLLSLIAIAVKYFMVKAGYPIMNIFWYILFPLNFILARILRNRKYPNSVLHISFMVHIPYYATRILRKQGVKADYLALTQSPWWNKSDYVFIPGNLTRLWEEFFFFWNVVSRYEVIHSHFGITMSKTGWEMSILKAMGRKIIVHFRGCEVRDPVKNSQMHPDANICEFCDYNQSVCKDGHKRFKNGMKWGDTILVTTPDMKDFVPEAIHFPFFCPEINYNTYADKIRNRQPKDFIKIVHATNHPGIEGTEKIKSAIENLKDKGYKIEFKFLKGVNPESVLNEYTDADIAIGKMKMGYYANAQIESMFLGVPTITYVRPEFMTQEIRDSGLIISHLNDLEKTLEYYISHPEELEKKRKIARSSILELHNNERLASWLIEIYGLQKRPTGNAPLKVLHIGNIANNAYYNAKYLRRAEIQADVLCYDNYWIMSSPEWEEVDFSGVPKDQIYPDWKALGISDYEHPEWFAQGPLRLAAKYLIAKNSKDKKAQAKYWKSMKSFRQAYKKNRNGELKHYKYSCWNIWAQLKMSLYKNNPSSPWPGKYRHLYASFKEYFPDRTDSLTETDISPFEYSLLLFQELFEYYDVIHAYATDPIYPMLTGFRPYVAFEHGTLRDTPDWNWEYKGPFYHNSIGRITALSYAMADHVLITNADCIESARRLNLKNYTPIPHPVTDENVFYPTDEHRKEIRDKLKTELVFFCPVRHDWNDKRIDLYLEALPELRKRIDRSFKVCFIPSGKELERSRKYIADMGCDDLVEWVGPFGSINLARWLSACDIVYDQLAFPAFSGLTPRALACGTPVVAAFDSKITEWMFPVPPPVLGASTTEEIVTHTVNATSPGFREKYSAEARDWFMKYHSSEVILKHLMTIYNAVLAGSKVVNE